MCKDPELGNTLVLGKGKRASVVEVVGTRGGKWSRRPTGRGVGDAC